jgi:hypothetical protein
MTPAQGASPRKERVVRKNQRVADMADEVLARRARKRSRRTGEPFEEALEAVSETEAGGQLRKLRSGPHAGEKARDWQKELPRERAEERREERDEAG